MIDYSKMKKEDLINLIKQEKQTNVTGCTFTGVKWDKTAVESINNVSKALLNLTELYKSQNINIESLISIGDKGGEQ